MAHRLEIDRISEAQREPRDDRVGVVVGAVEAAVDEPLHALAQRVEGAAAVSVEAATPTGEEREDVRGERDDSDEDADEEAAEDRVGKAAADQPVDVVQAVLENPDANAQRQRRDRRPGHAVNGVVLDRDGDHEARDADRGPAEQPA